MDKKIIAYFDFDGTLSNRDTLLPFLIYVVGYFKFITYLPKLISVLFLYGLKIIDNHQAKERTLTILFKNYTKSVLEQTAKSFAYTHLNKYLIPHIYTKLEWHREQGHKIALVSANLAIYLRYFANLHLIDYVIATEIEFIDNIASGRLLTHNCYGEHKVIRINQFLTGNNLNFDYSYGYGNSRGDHEMLNFVDEAYYILNNDFTDFING